MIAINEVLISSLLVLQKLFSADAALLISNYLMVIAWKKAKIRNQYNQAPHPTQDTT